MNPLLYSFKACKAIHLRLAAAFWTAYTRMLFWLNGVKCGSLKALGRARINVSLGGKATIPAGEVWGGNPATRIQ